MKKSFFTLISLFVTGAGMCNAEVLYTGDILKSDVGSIDLKKSPLRVNRIDNSEATNYFVITSPYNEIGVFGIDTKNYSGYPVKVEMPANGESGQVTITGIYDFKDFSGVTLEPVKAEYDADARTVTINTPFSGKLNGATKIGSYMRGDYLNNSVIVACEIGQSPDLTGQYPITTKDKLVFDVAEDGTLTPRSSWLIYSFSDVQKGILDIASATEGYEISDTPKLYAYPSEVNFPQKSVHVGQKSTLPLYILNAGRSDVSCNYSITGDEGLQLAARPQVAELSLNAFEVWLTPIKEGPFSGNITTSYGMGNTLSIPVSAEVEEAIDYSSIVKKGDFSFSLPESEWIDYKPWIISKDLTGYPVALASIEETGYCGLDVTLTVPQGETGILSWKGITQTMQPNGFQVVLDYGDVLYNNMYEWEGYCAPHNADGSVVIPAGTHVVTFEYIHQMDWLNMGLTQLPQQSYIWDLNLETYPLDDDVATVVAPTVDFGEWYIDKFIGGVSANAQLMNMGRNNLKVTGCENSESFVVVVPENEAEYMSSLDVPVEFRGTREGEYDETVTIKTTAGDYKVRCVAKATEIPVNYDFLVKEGAFSFGTGILHPFTADVPAQCAFSSTSYLRSTVDDYQESSWLSASFEVKENMSATLSWEADNSSDEFFVFMGDAVLTDGTVISIDGKDVAEFAGDSTASSIDIDEDLLTFGPGLHTVKFSYQKKGSEPKGDDRVVVKSISLVTKTNGIAATLSEAKPVNVTWYSLDGRSVNNPQNGVYVRKTTYSDGSVKNDKVMVK